MDGSAHAHTNPCVLEKFCVFCKRLAIIVCFAKDWLLSCFLPLLALEAGLTGSVLMCP